MAFGLFKKKEAEVKIEITESDILRLSNIRLNLPSEPKNAAIEAAGRLLVEGGYVQEGYIAAMHEREEVLTTYIGNGIAIPHGVGAARDLIEKSGICVLQYPNGVDFGDGKTAYLVIGIAGRGQEHMSILTNLAEIVQDEAEVRKMAAEQDPKKLLQAFTQSL